MTIDQESREALQENLTKQGLLEIINVLDIPDVDISERYSKLVDIILADFEENGVPEWGDCPALLRKFLITAKITTEAGDLIEHTDAQSEESPAAEVSYPECFGLGDENDPACLGCKVLEVCLLKHKESYPPCYGSQYSDDAEECGICVERTACKMYSSTK